MKRLVKLGIARLKALSVLVTLGVTAHAGTPYLPQIGPPPLRVAVVKSPALPSIKFMDSSTSTATNSPSIAEAKTSPAGTNVNNAVNQTGQIVSAAASGPSAPAPFIVETPDQALGDSFAASVFPLPTPDLLGISPQMLATYFHPLQTGTNFCAPNGPFHVIFMPPIPLLPSMVPDTSSHAEYIVK
jgi:hypothetical protein